MYSPRMTTIGDRLDKAMRDAKIASQKDLERLSGVPQATISRILKGIGKKGPETDTIKRLAKALNVTFAWLNEGIENGLVLVAEAPEPVDDGKVSADEIIELITLYKTANRRERVLMLNAARVQLRRRGRKTGDPAGGN